MITKISNIYLYLLFVRKFSKCFALTNHCPHFTDKVIKASEVEKVAHGHMIDREHTPNPGTFSFLPSTYHLFTQKQSDTDPF